MKRLNNFEQFGVIVMVMCLTVVFSSFLLLLLTHSGIIVFVGGGWLIKTFHLVSHYLGSSTIFFIPACFVYAFFFLRLHSNLQHSSYQKELAEKIVFYNGGLELSITIFFAIGVLFTAWGLQNALVNALGNVSKAEAASLGAWGILKRLVDNGILIALWTTIVGGAGGYSLRLIKYLFLGKRLYRFSTSYHDADKQALLKTLNAIQVHVKQIEQQLNTA